MATIQEITERFKEFDAELQALCDRHKMAGYFCVGFMRGNDGTGTFPVMVRNFSATLSLRPDHAALLNQIASLSTLVIHGAAGGGIYEVTPKQL